MTDPDHPSSEARLSSEDLAAIRQAMGGLRRSAPPQEGFVPRFPDLESWVHEFFVLTFGRNDERARWCARWWDHPEAVMRLDALWRTWEVASLDPVRGIADWISAYLDPNLAILLGPGGPFASCTAERHEPAPVLAVSPPPDDFGSPPRHWWEVLAEDDR